MAPKKAKDTLNDAAAGLTEEQQTALEVSQRLQAAAKTQGVLAGARRVVSQELPTPKLLLKADGKDLVKKSSQRKGRYLLNICAQIAPAAAGKLGSLAQLDSQNPVLYFDFPQGRLKFLGTIVFPRNKYMLLKFGQKDVLCEDIFENMIVFPEALWIGTKEENPTEQALPMPAELQAAVHEKYAFGSAAHQTGTATQPIQTLADMNEDKDESDNDDIGDDEPGPSQPTRISSRHKGKRPRYAEPGVSGTDEEAIEVDDGDEEEPPQKLPKLSQQGTPAQSKRRKSYGALVNLPVSKPSQRSVKAASKATAKRGIIGSSSDEDQEEAGRVLPSATTGKKAKKQPTLNAFLSKPASQGKASSQPSGSKATSAGKGKKKAEEVIDLLDEDDDSADASQQARSSSQPATVSRQQPRRARASNVRSMKEPSLSDADDRESQGSSDVEVQSAEEEDDDYEA